MSYTFSAIDPTTDDCKQALKFFFSLEFKNDDTGQDYLLPNGLPSFFYIHADSPVLMYFGKNEKPFSLQNGFYIGYCDTVIRYTHERAWTAGAVVYPIYFNMIFGKNLSNIMNQFVRIEDPPLLEKVHSLMRHSPPEFTEVFQLFEQYIIHQLNMHPLREDFSNVYCQLTRPGGYQQSVEQLAESLGYSTRHLNSRFRQHFGMSPKQFIKMVKFNHALKYIYDSDGERNLGSIAHEVGYYDQSHFIRDFKSICGKTPKELIDYSTSLANKFKLF